MPSLLSVMASEKSTVYVVFFFKESLSSTMILFPAPFISGISSCGGDTTTLLVASSTFIYSSKVITTFLSFTPVPLSAGVVATICGGLSSYQPPSGCPILAQLKIIIINKKMTR